MFQFLPFTNVFFILIDICGIISILVIVDIIVSYAIMLGARGVSRYNPWVVMLRKITDPLLNPFRRLVPPGKMQGFDISPILLFLVLQMIQSMLFNMALSNR